MNCYKVVGYEKRAGISRKSGKPYDMDIIHVVHEESISDEGCYGNRVESITYNSLINGPLEKVPLVGDVVSVYYNRSGFVTDIVKVKV